MDGQKKPITTAKIMAGVVMKWQINMTFDIYVAIISQVVNALNICGLITPKLHN